VRAAGARKIVSIDLPATRDSSQRSRTASPEPSRGKHSSSSELELTFSHLNRTMQPSRISPHYFTGEGFRIVLNALGMIPPLVCDALSTNVVVTTGFPRLNPSALVLDAASYSERHHADSPCRRSGR